MAAKSMNKLDKEDVVTALLVADDFNEIFRPFMSNLCSPLLPLASVCVLEYSLECLCRSGVHETILFCPFVSDDLTQYLGKSKWAEGQGSMKVTLVISERCFSLGDVMRDIDNKALIKSDFILMSVSTISNISLVNVVNQHKVNVKKDRGAVMTLVFHEAGDIAEGDTVIGFNDITKKLLMYSSLENEKSVTLPTELISEHPRIRMSTNLIDTGIAICSASVPVLFSDNFDFQTKEDFVSGVLQNEDALDSRMYCHLTNDYGMKVSDWLSYQRTTSDIIHRWTYPLVPDLFPDVEDTLVRLLGCVYKHPSASFDKGCLLEESVTSKSTAIGKNSRVTRSFLGENTKIGHNVELIDCMVLENVTIQDNCRLNLCVIGQNVQIGMDCSLNKCQILANTHVPSNTGPLEDKKITCSPPDKTNIHEQLGENTFILPSNSSSSERKVSCNSDVDETLLKGQPLKYPFSFEQKEDILDYSSDSNTEETSSAPLEMDDCNVFYNEVLDSLQRGYEEHLPCSNLILEINSSRYAYNISLEEVTQLTSKALFALSSRMKCPAKPVLVYFTPLFLNYIKTEDSQRQCLSAFEEMYEDLGNELNSCLHYLYEADILPEEIIQEWFADLSDMEEKLKTKIMPFIKWLNEAEETSDSE